ncbi:DUF4330 domain-containing protein [Spirulina sp. 06S082]|uniref:DUF4330 domain-containing protein n=1 Tax=Spirulina sp. 06S082 TaxID=3110248 RepID=UPI002B21D019|nr:DUF4330 domain-containing protein [Spirulina sp. 06S082]MEA5470166.1 DUF4330 domain-containing protein [Spirulina sp. 06S082]
MNILDSKGRLFGKLSILDLGAALVILLVIIGIFFVPGTSGSLAQVTSTKPIEVDVVVRGLSVKNSDELVQEMQAKGQTNLVIRNQPSGSVEIKSIELLERQIIVTQPDGSVKMIADPRTMATMAESFSTDMLIVLAGKAQITDNGAVLGKNQIKIGTAIELDGQSYNFNGSVIGVRVVD